jgi:hypothetical protein
MAAIILPRRWQTQPQGVVEIDWGNTLTYALQNALNAGAGIGFDAVSRVLLPVTAQFGTISYGAHGSDRLLLTPNGSAAKIAINQDWSGPSTTILRCVIKDIDASWGGIFSKNTSNYDGQLGIGRSSNLNNFYIGRENTASCQLTQTSISSCVNRIVNLAITNTSSGPSSTVAMFVDGVKVDQATYNWISQQTGNGSLYLGCSRDLSASFDSDTGWSSLLRWNRVLTDDEINEVSNSLWQIFKKKSQVLYFTTAGGLPTLSAISASNLTTTGARLTVSA